MSDLNPAERERVLRKIKHCLALSKSSNEHEAAAALRQAQKLMRKYQLSDLDVELAEVGQSSAEHVRSRRPTWDTDLSAIVAHVFGCRTFTQSHWTQQGRRKTNMERHAVFIGVTPAQQIAKYAYDTLYVKVAQARRDYIAKIRSGNATKGKHSPDTRGNHFAEMWVAQVGQKLHELIPRGLDDGLDAGAESDGRALIALQQKHSELIETYLNALTNGEGIKTKKPGRTVKPNLDDLLEGLIAGQKAQINPGIGSVNDSQLAIGGM